MKRANSYSEKFLLGYLLPSASLWIIIQVNYFDFYSNCD